MLKRIEILKKVKTFRLIEIYKNAFLHVIKN